MKHLLHFPPIDRASRMALRFFAGMLLLTLVARGTAGSAMARVTVTRASQGNIEQSVQLSAALMAEEGESIDLPVGVIVKKLLVGSGQSVKAGDALVKWDLAELNEQLEVCKVQRQQQKAQLAQLSVQQDPDATGVTEAQKNLTQTIEDGTRSIQRAQAELDSALTQSAQAQQHYEQAVAALHALQQQTDPLPDEETLAAAKQAALDAEMARDTAQAAVQATQTALEDAQQNANRSKESAQSALNQANIAFHQAKQQADLAQQASHAEIAGLKLSMDKIAEQIHLLENLIQAGGILTAPRNCQVLQCTLQEGAVCSEHNGLQLSQPDSQLLVQFSLSGDAAEKATTGTPITLFQDKHTAQATLRNLVPTDTDGTLLATAVLSDKDTSSFRPDLPVQAELVFSRTEYSSCLPVSAIREDSNGSFVLVVEEKKTAFGISNIAQRIPITVLEVASNGQSAAVSGDVSGNVIASATRAVKPGSAVRFTT